ncbi:MAG: alpha/beta hydrolase [Flavobacteriales bacterium]
MTIYLLPGVGTDKRLFDRIDLKGLNAVFLNWPPFAKGCTLSSIAKLMADQIKKDEPHILVGVSMGGMVAQELAAITEPEKVILISSWTGPHERPPHLNVAKKLALPNLINHFTMWATWPIKRVLGDRDRETDQLLYRMACEESAKKIRHGAQAIMRWKGSPWKGPVVRIHGDKDVVTPLRFPVDHIVKGGPHIMVLTKPKEVSDLIRRSITHQPDICNL